MGKTPFIKRKPNPFDEAVSLIWYLENVFYSTSGDTLPTENVFNGESIEML
jgi:phosphoenolpyruvate carboxylase